ncbi:MAG: PKD domain-containing protein [Chitinophagaceae bacterium]|nr:PKD domain-containing protein [Chitinophagaceae bacterium]
MFKKISFLFFFICLAAFAKAQPPCAAMFSYSQSSGNTFNFIGTAVGPGAITNYVWNFGDGSPNSPIQNPTHTYSAGGYYYVCLTVYGYDSLQNPFTCNYCDSVYAQSGSTPCSASFNSSNTTGNLTQFTNTSTAPGTITGYSWTFGDGGGSTLANPSHTYANPGYYNVCLVINGTSSAGGFQCYTCDSIYVGASGGPCNASFNYTQTSGANFSFMSTSTGPGTITNYSWNFGDGSPNSSVMNPTHTYANSGNYNVCLTIYGIDSNNNTYTCTYCDSTIFAQASNPCVASFFYTNPTGNVTQFNNTSTAPGTINGYNWTFGDGGGSTTANPSHTYANPGYYNVCLTIYGTSSAGGFQCYTCDSIYVGALGGPCNASFNYSQTSGASFNFVSTSTGPGTITNYSWNFGDGSPNSSLMNPTHTYANSGNYNVCLTIYGIDSNNTTYSCTYCDSTIFAQASNPCNASFNFSNPTGNMILFNNTSTGPGTITGYSWTFGDGGTSTSANPSHTYANSGYYNVCLVINGTSSAGGFQCYTCDSIYVGTSTSPCNASFTYTQTSGASFNFVSTSTGPGTITNYSWNFGDGSPTSSVMNPTHTYANSGNYNVCLTIYGIDSNNNTYTCTYCDSTIFAQASNPCVASFFYTNPTGNVTQFNNTSTAPGTINGYNWTFGDGGGSTSANPTHTYANPGYYNVCLTIYGTSSAGGFQCYTCDSIYVGASTSPCNASFTYTQTSGASFNFVSTSVVSGTITNYIWNFGDGSPTSSAMNPSHTYANSGNYMVCLTLIMVDSNNQTYTCTYCDSTIYAQAGGSNCFIQAGFTQSISGNNVNFINTSSCVGCVNMTYLWNFGDGSPASTVQNPTHTYTNQGSYNVCLYVSGYDSLNNFCKDSFCHSIMILPSGLTQLESTELQIFPNPANDQIEITLPLVGKFDIKLIDMAGKTLLRRHYDTQDKSVSVDISDLSKGLYLILLNQDDKQYRQKLMKQ